MRIKYNKTTFPVDTISLYNETNKGCNVLKSPAQSWKWEFEKCQIRAVTMHMADKTI